MSRLKIQISYTIKEEAKAAAAVAALRSAIPEVDPRYKEKHPPRKHIYITIREPDERT